MVMNEIILSYWPVTSGDPQCSVLEQELFDIVVSDVDEGNVCSLS